MTGGGIRSLDGLQRVSTIACGANNVALFNVTAKVGLFTNFTCEQVGATAVSGSSCMVITGSYVSQSISRSRMFYQGWYDAVDVQVGDSWHGETSIFQDFVHWGERIRNTVNVDSGDWILFDNRYYGASGADAAIRWESSGGGHIAHNAVVSNGVTRMVHGISADTTGANSGQMVITENKVETTSGIPFYITKGWPYMVISNNIARGLSNINPALLCVSCNVANISGNVFEGTGNAITIQTTNALVIGCNTLNFTSALLMTGTNTLFSYACPTFVSQFYAGPGDIVPSNWKTYWGLRSFTLATVGARVANICNAGDASCADVLTTTAGLIDVTQLTGAPLSCGGAGGQCTIKTWYDQSGGLQCGGAACDMTQATVANRYLLVLSCVGQLPCARWDPGTGSNPFYITAAVSTIAQPYTVIAAAKRTSTTVYNTIISDAGGTNALYFHGANKADLMVNAVDHDYTAPDGAWTALQAVVNGANSSGVADGTITALNTAATNFTTAATIRLLNDLSGGVDHLRGDFYEAGINGSAFNAATIAAMNTNMHVFGSY